MNDDQELTLWVGATRYYTGRMTYAVSGFVDLLVQEWPKLPEHARAIIARDLDEEFARDDFVRARLEAEGCEKTYPFPLGHDCDRAQWERVRRLYAYKHRNAEKENSDETV